ncbi:hypothetical protein BH10PSE17_BH10PSE17_09230 [soil metagenome]
MTECIVLIRRFVKSERCDDYIDWFARQPKVTAAGFKGKSLTRVDVESDLPAALNTFHIGGNGDCVTFVMVERWDSVEHFKAFVPNASTVDQDEFEAWPRQRVVLPVVG